MDTTIVNKKDGKSFNKFNQEIVNCTLCNGLTAYVGTKLCDRCWELKKRILSDIKLTIKILEDTEGCVVLQQPTSLKQS